MVIRMTIRPYQPQGSGLAKRAVTTGLGVRGGGKGVLQLCAFIASLSAVALCVSVFANNLTLSGLRETTAALSKFSPSEDRDSRPLATARGRVPQNYSSTSASKVIKSSLYRSHEKSRVTRSQDPRTGKNFPFSF